MTQEASTRTAADGRGLRDWALRPWALGALGACAGLALHFLLDNGGDESSSRAGLAAFVFFGAAALAFSLDPKAWRGPALFALTGGLVMGGLAYNAIENSDKWAGTGFAFAAGVLATLLALPLFQAGFATKRFATSYKDTHFHLWTDAVSGAGALVFVGLSWTMLFLLDGLLSIVGITFIGELTREEWFGMLWSGGSFGAALGVLRNNLKIIGSMQWLVLLVLSLLAIPLAAALIVFLAALLLTGGAALWATTSDATAILLACGAGCFIFVNAIIRDDDDARSKNRVMLGAGAVLAFGIFPLALFAAISTGIRINQYGLSPERIWALVAVLVALAYGAYYWFALIRGRLAGWADNIRSANLMLAVCVCALALFLSLPILNFGAISARDQLGRLQDGEVAAGDFDFAALKWDFGDAGREVLAELAAGEGEIATLAAKMQESEDRPYRYAMRETETERGERQSNMVLASDDPLLRAAVENWLSDEPWRCDVHCRIIETGDGQGETRSLVSVESRRVEHYTVTLRDEAQSKEARDAMEKVAEDVPVSGPVTPESEVEIREYTGRQVYVDGQAVGQPFQ